MDCLTFTEIDSNEWSDRLLAPLEGRRYPLGGSLDLTPRCNLNCVHCYIRQPAGDEAVKAGEMTTDQFTWLIDRMAEAGTLFLLITGGEPLLRPDFEQIYTHAKRRGMLISLFTNATLLTPRLADLLAELRPHSIEVTLYGATAETYEKVTGVPGSYQRCRRGIDLLLERGLPLTLKNVQVTLNRHELEEMKSLAAQMGVNFRYDGLLWPRLDGSREPLRYQLPLDELIALDTTDPERAEDWHKVVATNNGKIMRTQYVYSCGAGYHSYHIDHAGRMSICAMSRRYAFDIFKMSFQKAWQNIENVRKIERKIDTPCLSCPVGELCIQCPGWSQVVHGDDETIVDFVCDLGHSRAEQFKAPVNEDLEEEII